MMSSVILPYFRVPIDLDMILAVNNIAAASLHLGEVAAMSSLYVVWDSLEICKDTSNTASCGSP